MALDARKALAMLDSLEEFLSAKAAEETMGAEESPSHEAMEGGESMAGCAEKTPGMGVVIELGKAGPPKPGKVPGCPDCEDGTPHQHAGK